MAHRQRSAVVNCHPTVRAPNGNTVAMEEQLGNIANTSSTQELVTNLYHKYQTMFQMVLGRSG